MSLLDVLLWEEAQASPACSLFCAESLKYECPPWLPLHRFPVLVRRRTRAPLRCVQCPQLGPRPGRHPPCRAALLLTTPAQRIDFRELVPHSFSKTSLFLKLSFFDLTFWEISACPGDVCYHSCRVFLSIVKQRGLFSPWVLCTFQVLLGKHLPNVLGIHSLTL